MHGRREKTSNTRQIRSLALPNSMQGEPSLGADGSERTTGKEHQPAPHSVTKQHKLNKRKSDSTEGAFPVS